jgi:arylsulfatase
VLRFADPRPQLSAHRDRVTYFPNTQTVPTGEAPALLNRAHAISAAIEIPKGGAEGVIVSQGGVDGGYTLFVMNKKLCYEYNYVAADRFYFESKSELPEGKLTVRYEFEPTGAPDFAKGKGSPGRARLYVNDKLVGETEFPHTIPLSLGLAGGIAVGRDEGAPVSERYEPPFAFTGTIEGVTFDVSGAVTRDADTEMRVIMAHQ